MQNVIQGALAITLTVVLGLIVQHPATWRTELTKLQYLILKEVSQTNNWGCPSIFGKCGDYPSKGRGLKDKHSAIR